VNATIISAPSFTKNADKARDPEMHFPRKTQQWYFGTKLHIGVDSQTGLAQSAVVTAVNGPWVEPLPTHRICSPIWWASRGGLSDSHFTSSIPLVQATLGPNILLVALLGWNIGIDTTASHGRAQAMSARAYALLGAEAHARVLAGGII
jgi:hypothetical protein